MTGGWLKKIQNTLEVIAGVLIIKRTQLRNDGKKNKTKHLTNKNIMIIT